MLISLICFLGRHARLVLPAGIIAALLLPEITARWDLILPVIITLIYAASMIRLDLKHSFVSALRPKRLLKTAGLSLFILCFVPISYVLIARLFGLADLLMPSLVWYAVAPPIASTVWICTLLGFPAALAMEIVVLTSLAAPFTGPFLASFILHDIAAIDPLFLFFRLAGMIMGGTFIALCGQWIMGRQNIERHREIFDGLSSLAMLVFLVPVFNGMGPVILLAPEMALSLLGLAILMNLGIQAAIMIGAQTPFSKPYRSTAQVMSVVTGNRNVGLYFAALPPDPIFGLFTAMYQVPLYLTPLLLGSLNKWLMRAN